MVLWPSFIYDNTFLGQSLSHPLSTPRQAGCCTSISKEIHLVYLTPPLSIGRSPRDEVEAGKGPLLKYVD